MTEKTEPKKPIWELTAQEEIEKGRTEFNKRIQDNTDIATKLKKKSEEFIRQPNTPPILPTMEGFLHAIHLLKLDHTETLQLIQYLIEELITLENRLATKLQYLDDNMQTIAQKTETQLSTMKNDVTNVQEEVKSDIYQYVKEREKMQKLWEKMGEDNRGIIA